MTKPDKVIKLHEVTERNAQLETMVKNLRHNNEQMQKAFKSAERIQNARSYAVNAAIEMCKSGNYNVEDMLAEAEKIVAYVTPSLNEVAPDLDMKGELDD